MEKFWLLLSESVILQGCLALLFAGTVCYMYIVGATVPEPLVNALMLILGFYFGGKTTLAARRR